MNLTSRVWRSHGKIWRDGVRRFSLNEQQGEDCLRKSIEAYRVKANFIDLESAATTHTLSPSSTKPMITGHADEFAILITRYPTMDPDPTSGECRVESLSQKPAVRSRTAIFVIFRGILSGAFSTLSLLRKK